MPTVNTPNSADREHALPADDPVRVLAERVRALRVSTGLSQRGLGEAIFLSHTVVYRIENGHWPLSWSSVKAVLTGCGVPGEDLPRWEKLWERAREAHASLPVELSPDYSLRTAVEQALRDRRGREHRDRRRREQQAFGQVELTFEYTLKETRSQARVSAPWEPEPSTRRPLPRTDHAVYRSGLFKPDPARVRTVAEYVDALRQLRASVSSPSWREMAARTGYPHNTLHDLVRLGRAELKWPAVEAFLCGCGLAGTEIDYWHSIFRRLLVQPRPRSFRRSDPHTPPPSTDFTAITSVPALVDALKELAGASKRSTDAVVRTARMHPGTRIMCRSALFGRFRRAITTGVLPEREVVIGYLRGCYCRTLGHRCAPDCSTDLIAPWLRVYDELHLHTDTARTGDSSETLMQWADTRGVA